MMFLMYMAGFAAYILLAALIGWFIGALFTQRRWLKGFATFLFILLIPIGDFIASRVYFQHLCRTQGGLKVFERVEGVEGYLILNMGVDLSDEMKKPPYKFYRFVETEFYGKYTRFAKMPDGSVQKEQVDKPASAYAKRHVQDRYHIFNIGRDALEVIEIATGRVIARKTTFGASWTTFRPWLSQESCPYTISSGPDIVIETLVPVNQTR